MTNEEIEDWKKMFDNPQTTYLSKEDYDAFVKMLEELPSEATIESIRRLMNRKSPWGEEE